MTIINSNLLTSHVVQTAVQEISKALSTKFNPIRGMPVIFYDWQTGYSNQWQQYFAKVPAEYREHPWYAMVYTYAGSYPNNIQPRQLLENYIPLYSENGVTIAMNAITRLTNVDVLCTVLTNDGNYANAISLNRVLSQSYWKNIEYTDIFYPQRKPNTEYPANFTVIPLVPNNCVYISLNAGKTSNTMFNWPTEIDSTILDGNVTWKCIAPRKAKMELNNFTASTVKVPNVYTDGIKYIVEFSFTCVYVGLEDTDYILSTIRGFDNHLYEVVSNVIS